MAEKQWPDWTDFYKGQRGAPEDPRSRPVTKNYHQGGEDVTKDDLRKDAQKILDGFKDNKYRQATNQELFGHLVTTEEQVQKAESNYNNKLQNWFDEAKKPIKQDPRYADDWGNCKSFNDSLSDEELAKRNMYLGE